MIEPKIVTATGSASGGAGRIGPALQQAMNDAILEIQKESEAIWADPALSSEEKKARIDALNDPKEVLRRKLEAKDKKKVELREAAAAAAKKQAEELAKQ